MTYLPRIVDAELDVRLGAAGAVVIEGPKASGKTETARQRAASSVLLDVDENARRAAAVDPSLVLDGPTPRLIDEWQVEPGLWNHVRRARRRLGRPPASRPPSRAGRPGRSEFYAAFSADGASRTRPALRRRPREDGAGREHGRAGHPTPQRWSL